MTRVTKMGRKTHEQATPYDRPLIPTAAASSPSTTTDTTSAAAASRGKRAPLQPQSEVESQLGLRPARSEARRQRRERDRNSGKVCFACRKEGHRIQDCPETTASGAAVSAKRGGEGIGAGGSICYRCGKSDHALKQCRVHPSKGLPFARCFVCKEQGHITSNCPTNSRGIYPSGGCCKICKSVEHLAKDCPLPDEVRLGTVVGMQSLQGSNAVPVGGSVGADDDDFHDLARAENHKRSAAMPTTAAAATGAQAKAKSSATSSRPKQGTSKKVVSF